LVSGWAAVGSVSVEFTGELVGQVFVLDVQAALKVGAQCPAVDIGRADQDVTLVVPHFLGMHKTAIVPQHPHPSLSQTAAKRAVSNIDERDMGTVDEGNWGEHEFLSFRA
jgi:hypothetical protein